MMTIQEYLSKLYNSDEYPMHMPGHKRTDMGELSSSYHLDVTEIEGSDNLYDAQGILKDAMDRASRLYKCTDTLYLVNGSTVGILISIFATTNPGDNILVAGNCHRSVFSGAEIRGLHVESVTPGKVLLEDIDGAVSAKVIEKALGNNEKDFKAVIITSPNYDGVVSDVQRIAKVCHSKGIPLIVDEAHGAHFSMDERLPKGAIDCGADIVIHSTHKTLAAMTQTALLHVQSDLVDINLVKKYWHILQTSSPSYVLMASIDEALLQLEADRKNLFDAFFSKKEEFLNKCKGLKNLHILNNEDIIENEAILGLDPFKIVVTTKNCGISGVDLQCILLDEYHIQLEMASKDRIIAIVTYADSKEGFDRFANALIEIDDKINKGMCGSGQSSTQASSASGSKRDLYAPCIP